jgi:hypothetical protein
MAEKIPLQELLGHWIHSHEEDTPTEMVFRPAQHRFPPSRGRHGFELRPDGSYVEMGIGPADKPKQAQGTWDLKDDNQIAIRMGADREPRRVLNVSSLDKDRLVIRK